MAATRKTGANQNHDIGVDTGQSRWQDNRANVAVVALPRNVEEIARM